MAKKARAVQRKIAIRVIRAYRTISLEVALLLARNPPIELQAGKLKEVYIRKRAAEEENTRITDKGLNLIRKQEQGKMIRKWRGKLMERTDTGRGFNWEILSCFREWVERSHGELTYQATQIITGHDCFKGYTHRIGKAENSKCSFCKHEMEDNGHVLLKCEEWGEEREELKLAFGRRVNSLGAMLRGAATDPKKWNAMLIFSKKVMDRKEEVEREEQAEARKSRLIRETEELLGEVDRGTRRRMSRHSMRSSQV